jgi:hypothetical protein
MAPLTNSHYPENHPLAPYCTHGTSYPTGTIVARVVIETVHRSKPLQTRGDRRAYQRRMGIKKGYRHGI